MVKNLNMARSLHFGHLEGLNSCHKMTVGTQNTFLLLYFLPSLIILFVFIICISPSILLHLGLQCAGPNSSAFSTGKL